MTPELRLIAAPRDTYAALVRSPSQLPAIGALRRPALVALVIGVSVAMTSSGRATPALVLSTTTAELPVAYVKPGNARSLCGKRLDWVEAVG